MNSMDAKYSCREHCPGNDTTDPLEPHTCTEAILRPLVTGPHDRLVIAMVDEVMSRVAVQYSDVVRKPKALGASVVELGASSSESTPKTSPSKDNRRDEDDDDRARKSTAVWRSPCTD